MYSTVPQCQVRRNHTQRVHACSLTDIDGDANSVATLQYPILVNNLLARSITTRRPTFVLRNTPLQKSSSAASGGAEVVDSVVWLACPPVDPARCARPCGRARAGRPAGAAVAERKPCRPQTTRVACQMNLMLGRISQLLSVLRLSGIRCSSGRHGPFVYPGKCFRLYKHHTLIADLRRYRRRSPVSHH